jgi:Fic family protein
MFCCGKYKNINEHELAIKISELEGKKSAVNIAQIKEILNITLQELGKELSTGNKRGIIELIKRNQK